jgi:hypothetical protein
VWAGGARDPRRREQWDTSTGDDTFDLIIEVRFFLSQNTTAGCSLSLFWWPFGARAANASWTGTDYVVAWRYDTQNLPTTGAWFVGTTRLSRSGLQTSLRFTDVEPSYGGSFRSSVPMSSDDRGHTLILHNGETERVVAFEIEDLQPIPSPPNPPADVAFAQYPNQSCVTWRDTSADELGFVITTDGLNFNVPADSRSGCIPYDGLYGFFVRSWNAGGFSDAIQAKPTTFPLPGRRHAARH